MELYLVRHADALEAGPGMPDAARPLSDEGRDRMKKGAGGLRKFFESASPALTAILSSPKVRAVETARILARELNGNEEITNCPPLAGTFRWPDLLPYLTRYPHDARVALVGHEPDLGNLAGWLVSGARVSIPLKKGGIACFEIDAPEPETAAELLWLLTPKQLRHLR